MGPVSRAKGIVDVDVSKFGQRRPKGVDLFLGGLCLQDTSRQNNFSQFVKMENKINTVQRMYYTMNVILSESTVLV